MSYPKPPEDDRYDTPVISRGLVYVAAQYPDHADRGAGDPDAAVQTTEAMGNVMRLLSKAGTSIARLISLQIFIDETVDRERVAEVIRDVTKGHEFNMTFVTGRSATPGVLVEIGAVAEH